MSASYFKKMIVFSSVEIKEIVEKYVQIETTQRECSQSRVVEELLLDAIYERVPESRTEITQIFKNRYLFGYNKAIEVN